MYFFKLWTDHFVFWWGEALFSNSLNLDLFFRQSSPVESKNNLELDLIFSSSLIPVIQTLNMMNPTEATLAKITVN